MPSRPLFRSLASRSLGASLAALLACAAGPLCLAALDMKLEVSDAVLAELAKVGFDPLYGARPLKRAIQSSIENPLAKEILEGRFAPKEVIAVDYAAGRFTFTPASLGKRAKAA